MHSGARLSSATSRPHTVYTPIKGGIPPLGDYLRRTWQHREFAMELARSTLRANNAATTLGQVWQMLNPILMAGVYYLVWGVLLGRTGNAELDTYPIFTESYLTFLVGGIFVINFTIRSTLAGAKSVVKAGGLLFNSNFPRIVFPLSSVLTEFYTYLPMLGAYFMFHVVSGFPIPWTVLLLPWLLVTQSFFSLGVVLFFSTVTVYFRDTSNILPHLTRILFFLSPVLWVPEEARQRIPALALELNPMVPFLHFWNEVVNGVVPDAMTFATTAGWAVLAMVVGGIMFLRNEHDFAVRV